MKSKHWKNKYQNHKFQCNKESSCLNPLIEQFSDGKGFNGVGLVINNHFQAKFVREFVSKVKVRTE